MTRACDTCNRGCGNGVAQTQRDDEVFQEMCAILCRVRQMGCLNNVPTTEDGRQQLSREAERQARESRGLQGAVRRNYPDGARALVDTPRLVPFSRAIAGRTAVTAERVREYLDPIRQRIEREARDRLGEQALRTASRWWTKFVPGLNVLTTLLDVYDVATLGYELYQQVEQVLRPFDNNPNVYEVRPDLAIETADGRLEDIYDFKFEGDRYRNAQDEIYGEAIGADRQFIRNERTVSPRSCECDGRRRPNVALPSG